MVFILHKWVFLVVSSGFELMKEATFGQKMIINLIDVSCETFFLIFEMIIPTVPLIHYPFIFQAVSLCIFLVFEASSTVLFTMYQEGSSSTYFSPYFFNFCYLFLSFSYFGGDS